MTATTAKRTVASAASIVLMTAVPPAVLAFIGWPTGASELTADYVWLSLRALSLPAPLLLALLTAAAWLAWGLFALLVAADAAAIVRGRTPRLALMKLVAAGIAGGALTATAAAPALAAVPPAGPAAVSAQAHAADGQEESEQSQNQAEDRKQDVERVRVVSFAFDSAEITPQTAETLRATAGLVQRFGSPGTPVAVTGHTDASGDAAYNQELSQKRADAVAAYLREQLGPDTPVTATGLGSAQPRAETGLGAEGERRAEITYTLAPPPPPPDRAAASGQADTGLETGRGDHGRGTSTAPGSTATGLLGLGAGGAAGLAGGWVLASRRPPRYTGSHARRPRSGRRSAATGNAGRATEATAEATLSGPATTGPVSADLVDGAGRLLLAGTHRVDAGGGLAVTGACAHRFLADLVQAARGDTATEVAVTRTLARMIGLDEASLSGTALCADPGAAVTRAEAAVLARARRYDTDEDADDTGTGAWTLLLLEAPAPGPLASRLTSLVRSSLELRQLVVVYGHCGGLAVLDCADSGRATFTPPDGPPRTLTGFRLPEADPAARSGSGLSGEGGTFPNEPPAVSGPHPEAAPALEAPLSGAGPKPSTGGPGPAPAEPVHPEEPDDGAPLEEERTPRVALRLFAPRPTLECGGAEIAVGVRSHTRLLLALLALRPEGVSTDEVTETLAPGADPAQAKNLRNTATTNARSLVRSALGRPDEAVVIVAGGRYRLDEAAVDVDVWNFEAALDRARTAPADQRTQHLEAALDHYTAALLAECDEPWLESHRQHYRRTVCDSCVELADRTDDPAEALKWLERSLAEDEYNEVLYQRIMRAQDAVGRDDAVQRTYRVLVEKLGEIGVAPSHATTRLLEELTSIAPPARRRRSRSSAATRRS